jgi:ATP-dependent HslUV protease ATP-binding subunit HslU
LRQKDVTISFDDEAIDEIAKTAFEINAEVENIGARRLHTVMSRLLERIFV